MTAPPPTTNRPRLEIERDGRRVIVTIQLSSIYDAMQCYDELIDGARQGLVVWSLETRPVAGTP